MVVYLYTLNIGTKYSHSSDKLIQPGVQSKYSLLKCYDQTLHSFGSKIKGMNKESIEEIVRSKTLFKVDDAMSRFQEGTLPHSLLSACIKFLTSTLVDVNANETGITVDQLCHTFVSLYFFLTLQFSGC